jgi:hypothetical protein
LFNVAINNISFYMFLIMAASFIVGTSSPGGVMLSVLKCRRKVNKKELYSVILMTMKLVDKELNYRLKVIDLLVFNANFSSSSPISWCEIFLQIYSSNKRPLELRHIYCHYFRYCTNMTGNHLNRKSRSVQGGKNNRTKMLL